MYWLNAILGILAPLAVFGAVVIPWGLMALDFETIIKKVAVFFGSAAVLWLIAGGLVFAYYTNLHSTETTVAVHINKSERICESGKDGTCRYLVYTNKGVFQNTDQLLYMKFNSSDVYNQLQANKDYRCTVVGWRIEFWSAYKNIVRCS